jgi:hypothetical protein
MDQNYPAPMCPIHEAQLNRIEAHVKQIAMSIHGNGDPGLKTTVAEHTQTLAVVKRILWGTAAAIGTGLTTFAIAQLL